MASEPHPYLSSGITADSVPMNVPDRVISHAVEDVLHKHLVSDPRACLQDIIATLHDAGYAITSRNPEPPNVANA